MSKQKENVVVSLSGGLDSSTLLLKCLKEYKNIIAISFDYGQKHKVELERAQSLVKYLNHFAPSSPPYCPVQYQVVKLEGLVNLLDSHLVTGGEDVPEGHYEQDNMKDTVVPNRNKIFSSIIQAVALSTVKRTGKPCDIALGIHSGDHAIYPDCRQEFRDADFKAFQQGNWNSEKVNHYTPYLEGDKFTILQDGEQLCEEFGLDFDEVYKRTNTSYKPYPSGNSDYKSSSSVERILAFAELNRPDPIQYEDETGPVSWEIAKSHALKAEEDYRKN